MKVSGWGKKGLPLIFFYQKYFNKNRHMGIYGRQQSDYQIVPRWEVGTTN